MPAAPLTLVTGDEELLVSRAVADVVAAVRADDADADVRDVEAAALDVATIADIGSPSLFGERRVLVVRLSSAPADDVRDALIHLLGVVGHELTVVVVAGPGQTGKRVVEAAKAAKAKVVTCAKLKPRDRYDWVADELSRLECTASPGAVRALVDAVGSDLRDLAAACAQLNDDAGGQLDEAVVRRYFRGRADASGFVVADRAVEGDAAGALVELRSAFAGGLDPVPVVAVLGRQLRMVARVASARGVSNEVLARDLGCAPWMVDKARKQARRWSPDALVAAHRAVVDADLEVKGGGTDAHYATERAVLAVAAAAGR